MKPQPDDDINDAAASPTLNAPDPAMVDNLAGTLKQYWGYSNFRPLQKEAMALVMQDRDSLIVLPTGGGKSLCYQVPGVTRPGLALVVSPLISLMKDQVDSLTSLGLAAACINSLQSPSERLQVADRIRRRELRMLYIAPERLLQDKTLEFLKQARVSFVAIDEAHCISQWGHDFRPEYRQLKCLKEVFPGIGVHGYTATATPQVRQDIVEQLGLKNAQVLVGSFDRPNLVYRVERRHDAIGQIRTILDRHQNESGIIYCISRRNVDSISEELNRLGYRTLPYHAGLSDDERHRSQDAFIEENVNIIVATVAFGMGIDKSNVRFVVHAEMPKSLEHYQQESGRAGRDGLEAECSLLYSPADPELWQYLMKDLEDESVRKAGSDSLEGMRRYCTSMKCRHAQLVEHFGQTLSSPNCGACDVCLQEMEPVTDPLVTAQKILSSVIRQGQRFGAAYTAQVLKGSRSRRILENGHETLSTWGLLKAESEPQIRSWIDQLQSQGYLRTSGEYRCLELTPEGRALLQGDRVPILLRIRERVASAREEEGWTGVNRDLFEELRGMRNRLAVQKNVPPYIIFSDATLRALARHRPTRRESLVLIQGIGAKKQDELGPVVLFTIQQWAQRINEPTDLELPSGNVSAAALVSRDRRSSSGSNSSGELVPGSYSDLFEQQLTMDEIALQLDRSVDTVCRHLCNWIRLQKRTEIEAWLPAKLQTRIDEAIGRLGAERLKPLFEDLGQEIGYHYLRLAATRWDIIREQEQAESE